MRKKLCVATLAMLLGVAVCGCGSDKPEVLATIEPEKITPSVEAPIETVAPVESETPTSAPEEPGLTFVDLSKRRFEFSSGAGGWWEELTIERDGYFTGKYQDYDVDCVYFSSYSGRFSDIVKIDEYSYRMTLENIFYKDEPDNKENIDDRLYYYTDSYCLGDNDTFVVYLPGTPLGILSEDVLSWIAYYNGSETELTMPIIVDEENGYGIYSFERPSAAEDAKATLATYQESYDYYGQLLYEAMTTLEQKEYAGRMYEVSDECLNYLWNLIRYNVDEEQYKEILEEQRAWIKEKEAAAEAAAAEWKGGSFESVAYSEVRAKKTIERCRVLADYLQ